MQDTVTGSYRLAPTRRPSPPKGIAIADLHLSGRVAVVTGAASGIGRASALALAQAGAAVVVADLVDATTIVEQIEAAGARAVGVRCDITVAEQVQDAVNLARSNFGRLDILHANAGVGNGQHKIVDTDEAAWRRTIDVNLTGTWLCLRAAARTMIESRHGGAIVITSSASGLNGFATIAGYAASKAALINLAKTAALELAEHGIRVNAIAPGPIGTEMLRRSIAENPNLESHLRERVPLSRPGTIAEVANTVVWLASDWASYITGAVIPVDGGQTAG